MLALVKKPGDEMTGIAEELQACEHPNSNDDVQPYEELLADAMRGNQAHFASEEFVEEAWRIVQPVLGDATPLHFYDPGTWGPGGAEALGPEGGWHDPS
jgi:glucose-6-phosphate 1-dehydrogenase